MHTHKTSPNHRTLNDAGSALPTREQEQEQEQERRGSAELTTRTKGSTANHMKKYP